MSRPPPGPVGDFQNIAIIRLSSIGDVIMALPALEGLRETYPRAKITWIVETRARNILEGHPAIDALMDFPRTAWRRMWKQRFGIVRSIPSIAHFYRHLHRQRFDLTLDLQGNLKSGTCTLASRAKVRVGFAKEECREPNHYFTNRRLSLGGQAVHRMDRDLLLVGQVGVPFRWRRPRIAYSEDERRVGDTVLKTPNQGPKNVILHPGTSDFMPHKRWALENYAALGDRLARELSARVLLSWGPGEEAMVERLSNLMETPAEILPKTPSMKSLGHLLSRADLMIGGDTGPVHLAVVQDVPTIGIMGPSDPRHYYPHGEPGRVFYRRVGCSPCRHRACASLDCLTGIAAEGVFQAARKALENPKAALRALS